MKTQSHFSLFALAGFILAVLCGIAAVLAGFGSRWEWWNFRTGFVILRWAAYGSVPAAVLSAAGMILTGPRVMRRGFLLSIAGLLIGGAAFGIPFSWARTAKNVPPIHDITTDVRNPPAFVSILPLRKGAPNSSEYGGPEVAGQQKKAYPDIAPVLLPLPLNQTFDLAYRTARKMGWRIIDRNLAEGRIEATATTFWFGFKDDIVIRVIHSNLGSRVDIRSVSRVGKSDVGTNARRIRKYIETLMQQK